MKRTGWLISRYLIGAIVPYFVSSWLLLSVILFVQQANRFSDIFFSVNIPGSLIWQLALALIPNVIAFTCPMAILIGTVIGLARLQTDSELVAIRAAGVGNWQIFIPIALLGVALSAFAFFVNLRGVPIAASIVRSVALQTAIRKLESPIEPGVFNTEVAGYTIYVKGGDVATGRWKNIFIHSDDPAANTTRLITSGSGRIDVTDEASELVLENATVSTIPQPGSDAKFVSENVGEVRFAIRTRRGELISKLASTAGTPEELGLTELAQYAGTKDGKERTEATILWYRRLGLSVTPFLFCILGASMMLRTNRAGRGSAMAIAFAGLVGYYLLAFGGEQLARTNVIAPIFAAILAPAVTLALAAYLSSAGSLSARRLRLKDTLLGAVDYFKSDRFKLSSRNLLVGLTTGLRDMDLAYSLTKYFALSLAFLWTVFVIFTAFELWKYAGAIDGGTVLLARYLALLSPFIYLQLAPSAVLVAVLATYVIKSRQNEIVTWISAGQSVYRLLFPCFLLASVVGGVNFAIQESVAPQANIMQDDVRVQIRKGGVMTNNVGRFWVANDRRIYSFAAGPSGLSRGSIPYTGRQSAAGGYTRASDNALASRELVRAGRSGEGIPVGGQTFGVAGASEVAASLHSSSGGAKNSLAGSRAMLGMAIPFATAAGNIIGASDNVTGIRSCNDCVRDLLIYEFSEDGSQLQSVYRSAEGRWTSEGVELVGPVERTQLSGRGIRTTIEPGRELAEDTNPFAGIRGKPSHLTLAELKTRRAQSESEVERNTFSVAVQRRYATLFAPLVIALFTAPFALSLSRKGKALTVGYAVAIWLIFVGVSNALGQFGEAGSISPAVAVWSPLVLFASAGIVWLTRVRT